MLKIFSINPLHVWVEFLGSNYLSHLFALVEIHMDQSSKKPAIRQNVVQESIDAKSNGADVEPTFSVGKSPLQGGQIGDVLASGAGGLGQGTPKVCHMPLRFKWGFLFWLTGGIYSAFLSFNTIHWDIFSSCP